MSYSVFIKTLRRLWEKWWELEHLNSRVAVLTDKYDGKRYRFKEVFLRNTKKAFVSFVPEDLVKRICMSESLPDAEYVKKLVQRRHLPLRFGDVREAHGTLMTKYLKESEINFLHGRVSSSIFMQHYFNPSLIGDLKERAFKGISEILGKIGSNTV